LLRPKGRNKVLGLSRVSAPTHGPNGGVADSLDEAKAAFRATGERPQMLNLNISVDDPSKTSPVQCNM
jgi:hypothetical protein